MANVFQYIADKAGYKNLNVKDNQIPLTNLTSGTPGPFNPNPALKTPFLPPNFNAKCPGGGSVCVLPGCPGLPEPEPFRG
jgi:hypothetical protein